jgi:transcriptional regulator with XRE-family HTH domain
MDIKQIGRFIAEHRQGKGLTQKDLAAFLRVSDKTISRWETGKGLPDPSSWQSLGEILSVSINEILSAQEDVQANDTAAFDRTLIETSQYVKSSEKTRSRRRIVLAIVLLLAVITGGVFLLKLLGIEVDPSFSKILITTLFLLLNLAILLLVIVGIVMLVIYLARQIKK